MSETVLRVDLSAGYRDQTVLQQVAFELSPGERLGLVGTSGAGKSTLLLALLGLLSWRGGWARGEVTLAGKNLLALKEKQARTLRGRHIALVPQSPTGALNGGLSLGMHFQQAWCAHDKRDPQRLAQRTRALMDRVHLPSDPAFLSRRPTEISVGQAQRCLIALALLHRPAIIVADEPTSALDPVTQAEVLTLLRETSSDDGTALLFVSHDLLSVLRLCPRIAVLASGKLGSKLPVANIGAADDPTLAPLLRALPLPLHVMLEHMHAATVEPQVLELA